MYLYISKNKEKEEAKRAALLTHEKIVRRKLELSYNENGKPCLNGLNISISHTEGVVIVAISDEKIGVDIENKNRKIKIKDIDIKRWTKIESYFKYMGSGVIFSQIKEPLSLESIIYTIEDFEDYYISVCSVDKNVVIIFV